MKAIVSHIRMDVAGGAEYMIALMANLLDSMGYDVTLISGTAMDHQRFESLLNLKLSSGVKMVTVPSALSSLLNPSRKASNALLTIYRSRLLEKFVKRIRPEIVLTDDEAFQKLKGMRNSYGKLINYVHYPYDNILNIHQLEEVRKRNNTFPYNVALGVYSKWARKHIAGSNFSDTILANSNFTRAECERLWARNDIKVLYPPIKIDDYKNRKNKENCCVVLGRIAPDKNVRAAIEAFRSDKLKDYKLIIAGQVIGQYSEYYRSIVEESKRMGNVQVIANPSKKDILDTLSNSKVLLHPRMGEHFGIVIAEAMASGCIPVVYNFGGPLEIIGDGKYGVIFDKLERMPDAILQAFSLGSSTQAAVVERAKNFDVSNFDKRFVKYVSMTAQ